MTMLPDESSSSSIAADERPAAAADADAAAIAAALADEPRAAAPALSNADDLCADSAALADSAANAPRLACESSYFDSLSFTECGAASAADAAADADADVARPFVLREKGSSKAASAADAALPYALREVGSSNGVSHKDRLPQQLLRAMGPVFGTPRVDDPPAPPLAAPLVTVRPPSASSGAPPPGTDAVRRSGRLTRAARAARPARARAGECAVRRPSESRYVAESVMVRTRTNSCSRRQRGARVASPSAHAPRPDARSYPRLTTHRDLRQHRRCRRGLLGAATFLLCGVRGSNGGTE